MQGESRKYDWKRLLCWIVWWKIDPDEMRWQVEGHSKLGLIGSARGLNLAVAILTGAGKLLLAGCFITHGLEGRSHWVVVFLDSLLLTEGALFFLLGCFAYRGKPWAMTGLMALWTFSIAWLDMYYIQYHIASWSFYVHPVQTSFPLVITLLGWPVGMHAFYFARQVERDRTRAA